MNWSDPRNAILHTSAQYAKFYINRADTDVLRECLDEAARLQDKKTVAGMIERELRRRAKQQEDQGNE